MKTFGNTCAAILLLLVPSFAGQQPDEDSGADEILAKERSLISRTVVNVLHKDGTQHAAKLRESPVLRYGDERLKIGDSTIWAWMHEGRPVAIQKIEVNKYFKPAGWTYNFTALSDTRVEVKWPNVSQSYTSQRPLEFHLIPDAPKPASGRRLKLQSRALSRQFLAVWGLKIDFISSGWFQPRYLSTHLPSVGL